MSVKITLTSNADAILQQLRENKRRALTAIGAEAVGAVKQQMASGYGRPIRRTGTLMGDVHSEVDGDSVIIGNSKDYAIYVHDGTRKMAGRPYIRDGIEGDRDRIQAIAEQEIRRGL